jgi:hypothetical protein
MDDFATGILKTLNKEEEIAYNLEEENPTEVKDWISTGSTILDYCISNWCARW